MEDAAALYLAKIGYEVLERNYRSRFGEIDIVGRHDGLLVFVEVKYRKPGSLVSAEESVTREKARRIRLTVRRYTAEKGIDDRIPIRIDLCVVGDGGRSFQVLAGVIEFS